MNEADADTFVFNGVDGSTGRPMVPALSAADVAQLAGVGPRDADADAVLLAKLRGGSALPLGVGHDPRYLDESGWGVIFPHGADPAIREALAPLLDHRKAQATAIDERRYRELAGVDGHRPGERKQAFLGRLGAPRSGAVEPDRMPYYLLIVGAPERVGFEFQAQLGLQYGVGRVHFETLDEYARYAQSVVAAETAATMRAPGLTFFAARNPGDKATELACDHLVGGLTTSLRAGKRAWPITAITGEEATKAQLARLLGGEAPALLFTSTHGVGFANGDPRQLSEQGALLCQDWPGAAWSGPLPPEFYFAGDDLAADADLRGVVAFLFACYGAGTPRTDPFAHLRPGPAPEVAPRAFLSRLPTRMLAHPRGGALAVIGHVDRAWACSFHGGRSGPEIETFNSALKRLQLGYPVGAAMEFFAGRYAELSSDLALELEDPAQARPLELAQMWTANNDARNYMVLGDPAVRVAQPKPRTD
jgi:hypothetical protein